MNIQIKSNQIDFSVNPSRVEFPVGDHYVSREHHKALLPVILLDCPYRTPLSGICWHFVQSLYLFLSLPSMNRSLTDAILTAALKRHNTRNKRAVLWTLDSLTDNTELLPFLEAIPDIIYGPAGFRHVHDHVFRLVLQLRDSHAAITLLLVISLDCPYHTPLSGICWHFVQSLCLFLSLPSTNRSLTDAILAAALKRRDTRDERAVLWTLDSLTDNTELLPFVEAIPDIIYGPAGFRRVDDHLFRLVLQLRDSHTSLPSRILALLWSAEPLPLDDPLRHRRHMEGLRALWALGIVASRISSAPTNTVYGINEASLCPLAIPESYCMTLEAVIAYVHLRNIKTRFEEIEAMLSLRDVSLARERKLLIRLLRSRVPSLDSDVQERGLPTPEIHSALAIVIQISRSHPEDQDSYKDLTVASPLVSCKSSGGGDTFDYTFADCNLDGLATYILDDIRARPGISDSTLRGIFTLCLWRKPFTKILDCESIFLVVESNTQSHSSPAFLTVTVILSSAMLSLLASKIMGCRIKYDTLGDGVHGESTRNVLQEVASHTLLHEACSAFVHDPAHPEKGQTLSGMEALDRTVSEISDQYGVIFTQLLSACIYADQLLYRAEAMVKYLSREWHLFFMSMSSGNFAHSVLKLVQCARDRDNLHREEVGPILQGLWEYVPGL
ncbi:hypothetical protein DFH09DRAFT_1111154 [Mycena vulgaris]|nr:hypothetical protein DFH09DRAFT_1111154 [Mycena vulgaris]